MSVCAMHTYSITANEAFLSSVKLKRAITDDDGPAAQKHSAEMSSVPFFN